MFEGKIALVTGASRGIGKEIASKLAANGAIVIVNYNGNKEAAEQVVENIISNGGKAEAYQCNVEEFDVVKEMMDYIVKQYGAIDIIVNNAGITRDNLLLKMKEQDFDKVLAVDLKGSFNVVKHGIRYMIKKRSGKIVNISSLVGICGNVGQINYSSAKAGLIGLTKSLAKEVASRNINVNAVAPGYIKTDMVDMMNDNVKANVTNLVPMKRVGNTVDVANAVCFLASEEAGYITGQVLEVNGGLNM